MTDTKELRLVKYRDHQDLDYVWFYVNADDVKISDDFQSEEDAISALNKLSGSVERYDNSVESVGEDDREALTATDDLERDQPEEKRYREKLNLTENDLLEGMTPYHAHADIAPQLSSRERGESDEDN